MTNHLLGDKIEEVYTEAKSKVVGDPCRATVFGFAVKGKSMIAICCSQEPVQETAAAFDKIRASFLPLK